MLQRIATTGLAMLVLAGSLMAQDERPQRGERGERGNRERGAFDRGAGNNSYLGLLRMDVVKTELKITEAQQQEIDRIAEEARAPRGDFAFNRDATPEERAAQFAEMREAANQREEETRKKLAGVLDETQNARLLGIWVQRVGLEALSNETVAAKIGLTDAQKARRLRCVKSSRPSPSRAASARNGPKGSGPAATARTRSAASPNSGGKPKRRRWPSSPTNRRSSSRRSRGPRSSSRASSSAIANAIEKGPRGNVLVGTAATASVRSAMTPSAPTAIAPAVPPPTSKPAVRPTPH